MYEDERVVAFLDINQMAEGHTLVVPRVHVPFWWDLSDDDAAGVAIAAKLILRALREVLDATGMLLEQRNGRSAGQEVFHMHLHLIPRGAKKGSSFADRAALDTCAARIRAALGRSGESRGS